MAKNATNPKKESESPDNLPLFFKKPVPLDMKRHAKATLLPTQDLSFAAKTNSIVVNAVEFFEAAKQYPIVFTQGENPLPAVIVGLEQKNYFVNSKGQWEKGAYLPAYVRKYPFVFMDVPDRNQFVLCVDEGASQYKENGGGKEALPLYNKENPSDLTRNALEFCTAYHNHHQLTRRFCEDIKRADLLTPTRSDARLSSGREIHLGGFQAIDEKKVAALPDETILEFFKKGWLPLIYAALMSSSNWKKLVDMAAELEKAKAN
jgi:hypothetical protein